VQHRLRIKALAKVDNRNASNIAGRSMVTEETSAFAVFAFMKISNERVTVW